MLWSKADGLTVRCNLCGHRCVIAVDKFGRCGIRQNIAGQLVTHSYDKIITIHPDPIEKKPLFHFLPGTRSLSIATPGCNFRCSFCQNWQISQITTNDELLARCVSVPPEQLVELAVKERCDSISYTYTEPTIFFELAYDTARLAHQAGLKNCFVSNGFMTPDAVEKIAPYLDAINVDLKAFSDETYRDVCGGRLEPVLECLTCLVAAGVWVEVTTLIVPGMNDSQEELRQIAEFIAGSLGKAVPWHISRFHGDYEMADTAATPLETLQMAGRLGKEAGLKFVYGGNATGLVDERTYCPGCGEMLLDRMGFQVSANNLREGKCPACNQPIEGVW